MKETIKTEKAKIKLPKFKGVTKITLTDINTGEEETIVEENLVTDAVANFFSEDAFGLLNLSSDKLLPLRNMYGGVLCFEESITENPALYSVPSGATNALIAHAGQTAHSSTSNRRGNPNGELSGEIEDGNGYKFVWDFAANQGNGTIKTVCLTHSAAGDIGTEPLAEYNEHPLKYVSIEQAWARPKASTTRAHALNYPVIYDTKTSEGIALFFNANNKLDIIKVKGITSTVTLNGEVMKFRELDHHEVTIYRNGTTAFSDTLTSMFVDTSANEIVFYGLGSATSTTLYIARVNLETYAVTNRAINLPYSAVFQNGNIIHKKHPRYPYIDGCLYLPSSAKTQDDKFTFIKIDINNPSASVLLEDSNLSEMPSLQSFIVPVNVSQGFVVGINYLINGDKVRQLPYFFSDQNFKGRGLAAHLFGSNAFITEYNYNDYGPYWGCVINAYYLATINVLSTPVNKQANQAMRIEYSLTEV